MVNGDGAEASISKAKRLIDHIIISGAPDEREEGVSISSSPNWLVSGGEQGHGGTMAAAKGCMPAFSYPTLGRLIPAADASKRLKWSKMHSGCSECGNVDSTAGPTLNLLGNTSIHLQHDTYPLEVITSDNDSPQL
jgi:hypothetical protein